MPEHHAAVGGVAAGSPSDDDLADLSINAFARQLAAFDHRKKLAALAALLPIVNHDLARSAHGFRIHGHHPPIGDEQAMRAQPLVADYDFRALEACRLD